MLKPDLSTASLHVINDSEFTPHDFGNVFFQDYRICEGALVSCWLFEDRHRNLYHCGIYTGLTSDRFADIISPGGPAAKMILPDIGRRYLLYSCPASGRFVLMDRSNSVAVLDLF